MSVNVNRIALLRNTRPVGLPQVARLAVIALEAGADGITVHPRPDARHITSDDVWELARLLKQWPQAEFNVEGNPFHNLMDLLRDLHAVGLTPQQATLVPDSVEQATSDHGWNLTQDGERLRPLIAQLQAMGMRVSLFMDPQAPSMRMAKELGADRVELIDPIEGDGPVEPLAEVLADPEVEIVLHAGRQDIALLKRCWQTEVNRVFDTQVAAAFAGLRAQIGYEPMLGSLLGVKLPKGAGFTHWERRPLSTEQLEYARGDVLHLLDAAQALKERLRESGREEWVAEECRPLEDSTDLRDPKAMLENHEPLNVSSRGDLYFDPVPMEGRFGQMGRKKKILDLAVFKLDETKPFAVLVHGPTQSFSCGPRRSRPLLGKFLSFRFGSMLQPLRSVGPLGRL